jgi:hypothetical protein
MCGGPAPGPAHVPIASQFWYQIGTAGSASGPTRALCSGAGGGEPEKAATRGCRLRPKQELARYSLLLFRRGISEPSLRRGVGSQPTARPENPLGRRPRTAASCAGDVAHVRERHSRTVRTSAARSAPRRGAVAARRSRRTLTSRPKGASGVVTETLADTRKRTSRRPCGSQGDQEAPARY